MHQFRLPIGVTTVALIALFGLNVGSQTQTPAQGEGVEVLARGPVHEAFAQPTDVQPEPGVLVKKQPPEPIQEMPPDQRPEGVNVQWIPGYFGWDDDASDFIWVSGCWRDMPPGREWMPGHWQPVEGGWVWVAGFWAPSDLQQVTYVPPPPPTLDIGPSSPAPDATSIYAPGIWVYQQNRYFWRPGHWVGYRPEWVWIPAYYVWTPSGCILVDDYWDRPLHHCGLLFAPVRFDWRIWAGGHRHFTPHYVVHSDFMLGALFIRPSARHYYFGDYFDVRFGNLGFVAWTDHHISRGAFDPHFSYYRHWHNGNPQWEAGLRELYRGRKAGDISRPPHTLAQQVQMLGKLTAGKTASAAVSNNVNLTNSQIVTALAPLKEVNNIQINNFGSLGGGKKGKDPAAVLKLQGVSKEQQVEAQKMATILRDTAKQRVDAEGKMLIKGGNPIKPTDPANAIKLAFPKPPNILKTPPTTGKGPPKLTLPKQEEKTIPKYDPPIPPGAGKKIDKVDKKDKKDFDKVDKKDKKDFDKVDKKDKKDKDKDKDKNDKKG